MAAIFSVSISNAYGPHLPTREQWIASREEREGGSEVVPSGCRSHNPPAEDFLMPPRRSSKKDSPAKLAGRMKRRCRVVLLRHKGEILGTVEAPDVASAKAAAAVQRNRIMVQELA